MKYIVVEEMGIEVPIIFSELQKHTDIAGGNRVIAAGFCSFKAVSREVETGIGCHEELNVFVSCWGESLGLKMKSRGKIDEELIMKHNEFRA